MADVDVVVLTYDRRDLVERCLESLNGQAGDFNAIVVDNGSSDDTVAWLRVERPGVSLAALPENVGVPVALNSGIAAGGAEHVIVLNNDIVCEPRFVESIVRPLRERPRVGMVAALLIKPGERLIDSFGLEFDRTLSVYERFAGEPYPPVALDERHLAAPHGGAGAYRRSALEAVGGFDERIQAYMEDADLALRIQALGLGCAGASDAVAVHLGSATIGKRSRRQVLMSGRSRAYMLRKYGVASAGPGTAAWALAIEAGVTAIDSLIGRDLGALRGRREGWRQAAAVRHVLPRAAINEEIGPREALRRRAAVLRPQVAEAGR